MSGEKIRSSVYVTPCDEQEVAAYGKQIVGLVIEGAHAQVGETREGALIVQLSVPLPPMLKIVNQRVTVDPRGRGPAAAAALKGSKVRLILDRAALVDEVRENIERLEKGTQTAVEPVPEG